MVDDTGCAAPDVMRQIDERSIDAPTGELAYVQLALPYVRGAVCVRGRGGGFAPFIGFAHPFERTFAELLSYYGVRWSYEPTAFALSWTDDGAPREMFTPDFYLPDHKLYIELTAMRQRLVTRKHRKVRRMRDLYPGVTVKLLYRRDYQRLARACRPYSATTSRPGTTVQDASEISTRIATLAEEISADCAGGMTPLALGVGDGGTAFLAAVSAGMRGSDGAAILECDRVSVSRFRSEGRTRGVHISRRPRTVVAGRAVLLFVDIVSSGLTLAYLTAWLRRRGAARIEVVALLSRESARLFDTPLAYVGFLAPHELVVGFGLSLFREFRGLTHIAALASGEGAMITPDGDLDHRIDASRLVAR